MRGAVMGGQYVDLELAVEVVRWCNVAVSMAIVGLMVAHTVARVEALSPREKRTRPWWLALVVVIAYGNGEAAAQDAPGGMRGALLLLVLVGLMVAKAWRLTDPEDDVPGRPLREWTRAKRRK